MQQQALAQGHALLLRCATAWIWISLRCLHAFCLNRWVFCTSTQSAVFVFALQKPVWIWEPFYKSSATLVVAHMRLCFVVLPLYFGGPTLSCILHICSSSLLLSKPLCFCFAHAHMMPLQYPPHCHCYPFSFAHTLLLSCYSFLCTTPASSFMQSFLFPFMQSFPFAFANSRHCGFVRLCFISFCVVFLLPCVILDTLNESAHEVMHNATSNAEWWMIHEWSPADNHIDISSAVITY